MTTRPERRVLLLDNYDSFTFNLVQAVQVLGAEVFVPRNDALTVDDALAWRPTHVMISPGPGRPEDAGISEGLIRATLGRFPLLGVCLGHQALVQVLGGQVGPARQLMHGKASMITHSHTGIFEGLPQPMQVGRYHSLAATQVPDALTVTARTDDGEVMAVAHRRWPAFGVQFHPESVLTPEGDALLARFLSQSFRLRDDDATSL
jgi:anthranilate synthase/aminodeoxychorismate synthase-like glutamine amidotransferase